MNTAPSVRALLSSQVLSRAIAAAFAMSVAVGAIESSAQVYPLSLGAAPSDSVVVGLDGSERVSLLGLGPQNTVTLINGRRTWAFSDLRALPLGAISSVDVVRNEGALFAGSDTLGGVVNITTYGGGGAIKPAGTEINLFYGTSGGKGGDVRAGSFITGFANDKLTLTFGAGYSDTSSFKLPSRFVVGASRTIPRQERTSYYAGIDYKVAHGMQVYGDIMVTDFNSPRSAGRDRIDGRAYRFSGGIRGDVPIRNSLLSGLSYDVGVAYEEGRFDRDISTSPISARRTR